MSEHGTGSGPAPQAGLASSGTSTGTSKPASSSASTTTPKTIGEPLITVRGVNKFFGDFQALKDIDLDIRRREVVALIGASGSGKSTDRKSTRLNSSHVAISYAVFCLKTKKNKTALVVQI